MNYQTIIDELFQEVKELENTGYIASYISELGRINPDKFGVCLTTLDGRQYVAGDSDERFSIQSISKVLSLTLAFGIAGEQLWKRVGVEPSGNPFNSLVQLEYDDGIPRNPFINAGAIVVCDYLISRLDDPHEEFIEFVRYLSQNPGIDYSPDVVAAEKATGFRNAALINLMKACNNIDN